MESINEQSGNKKPHKEIECSKTDEMIAHQHEPSHAGTRKLRVFPDARGNFTVHQRCKDPKECALDSLDLLHLPNCPIGDCRYNQQLDLRGVRTGWMH